MQSTTDNVSDSTPPTQPTRFKWKWIFYGIVALAYLPQLPGCLTAHASKFGRVVDANTGKGMAGITGQSQTPRATPTPEWLRLLR